MQMSRQAAGNDTISVLGKQHLLNIHARPESTGVLLYGSVSDDRGCKHIGGEHLAADDTMNPYMLAPSVIG
jgi:hypothetical protein